MLPEKMANRYSTPADIQNRLADTFLRYDGVPVYCSGLSDTQKKIVLWKLPVPNRRTADNLIEVPFNDEKLDISSIELGYANSDPTKSTNSVAYVYRAPKKSPYKQGVCFQTTLFDGIDGRRGSFNFNAQSQNWADFLSGVYPKDWASVLNEAGEVAVSREVAVKRDKLGLTFFYVRGEQIGYSTPKSDVLNIVDRASSYAVERLVRTVFPTLSVTRIKK